MTSPDNDDDAGDHVIDTSSGDLFSFVFIPGKKHWISDANPAETCPG